MFIGLFLSLQYTISHKTYVFMQLYFQFTNNMINIMGIALLPKVRCIYPVNGHYYYYYICKHRTINHYLSCANGSCPLLPFHANEYDFVQSALCWERRRQTTTQKQVYVRPYCYVQQSKASRGDTCSRKVLHAVGN